MIVRIILAVVVVFAAWMVLDTVMHNVILKECYEGTKDLWRPPEKMKVGLIAVATGVVSICFVSIYAFFTQCRCAGKGVFFGLLWGIAAGVSMSLGTYATMDIPMHVAVIWCLGTIVKGAVAGLLVGLIVTKPAPAEEASTETPAESA